MSSWSSPTKRRKAQRLNCERKIAYETLAAAEIAMNEVREAGKAPDIASAYRCPNCGKFHWGRIGSHTKIGPA